MAAGSMLAATVLFSPLTKVASAVPASPSTLPPVCYVKLVLDSIEVVKDTDQETDDWEYKIPAKVDVKNTTTGQTASKEETRGGAFQSDKGVKDDFDPVKRGKNPQQIVGKFLVGNPGDHLDIVVTIDKLEVTEDDEGNMESDFGSKKKVKKFGDKTCPEKEGQDPFSFQVRVDVTAFPLDDPDENDGELLFTFTVLIITQ